MKMYFHTKQLGTLLGPPFTQMPLTDLFDRGEIRGFRRTSGKRMRELSRASVLRMLTKLSRPTDAVFVDGIHVGLFSDDPGLIGSLKVALSEEPRVQVWNRATREDFFNHARIEGADALILCEAGSTEDRQILVREIRAHEYLRDVFVLHLMRDEGMPADLADAALADSTAPASVTQTLLNLLGLQKKK